MTSGEHLLTVADAYEAAYRFVWQYAGREPESESLQLLLVAMEPTFDGLRTNDPASWQDWLRCVDEVARGTTSPRFPQAPPGHDASSD